LEENMLLNCKRALHVEMSQANQGRKDLVGDAEVRDVGGHAAKCLGKYASQTRKDKKPTLKRHHQRSEGRHLSTKTIHLRSSTRDFGAQAADRAEGVKDRARLSWLLSFSQTRALHKVVGDEAVVLEDNGVDDSVEVEVAAESGVSSIERVAMAEV
jgi:hypothetical protein